MSNDLTTQAANSNLPDYLTGKESSGIQGLDRGDIKMPRLKLLQPMSPEVRTFKGVAVPTEFWHTGANVSLGTEFYATPILVSKKVILFPPRDGGDDRFILAMSRNGKDWDIGGNQEFEVTLKDSKKKVIWRTGKDVRSSGLCEFGSSDFEDTSSPPAAMLFYEYLLYLRDKPELSPVAMSSFKTGLPDAQSFNTYLLSRANAGAPVNSNMVRFFSNEKSKDKNVWHTVGFQPAGNTPVEIFKLTEKMKEQYANYEAEVDREEMQSEATTTLKSDDI